MADIEEIQEYLQKCTQTLQLKHCAAHELCTKLDHDMKNASMGELQIVLEKFEHFTYVKQVPRDSGEDRELTRHSIAFEKMASIYSFLYQTFTEEIYNHFMGARSLETVRTGLDGLDSRLQFLYNTASDDQIGVSGKEKDCRRRIRLVRHQRAADARPTLVLHPAEERAAHSLPSISEHDAGPVAALRQQLEEVLTVSRPAHAVASAAQNLAQNQTGPAARGQTEDGLTLTEQRSSEQAMPMPRGEGGPLPTSTVSFSAVEEQVRGRTRHERSGYVTGEPYEGTAQPDSVNRVRRAHRNGRSVPRIFTGSFSELELGMESLRISATDSSTPLEKAPRTAPIMIRDFATPNGTAPATPIAAHVSQSPPAETQRRYAVLSGQTMIDKRYGGRSRVPSGRCRLQSMRSQTVGNCSRSNSSQRRRQNTL